MQIGLLQAGHMADEIQAELGDYDRLYATLFEGEGIDWRVFPVVDDVFPDGPAACDGWLISGSRHGAYEKLAWIARLEAFIRSAWEARVPVAGICFGHQIVAQALGGRVEKFDGGWAVGHHLYDWQGRPRAFNAWHQDQVVALPQGAEVLASSPFCAHAALAYRDADGPRAFTVQPHPEFDRRATEMLLDVRAPGVVPAALIAGATASLAAPTDDRALAGEIAAFFREALARRPEMAHE